MIRRRRANLHSNPRRRKRDMKGDYTPHCASTSRRVSEKRDSTLPFFVASHPAQLDHQVGVGLALPFLVRRQCTRRGRQAVPLLRKALRTSGSGLVFNGATPLTDRTQGPRNQQNRSALRLLMLARLKASSADLFLKVCGSPHRSHPRAADLQNWSALCRHIYAGTSTYVEYEWG